MNPVIFPEMPVSENLIVFSTSLSELAWKNRLVGLTNSGFLYVDEKVPKKETVATLPGAPEAVHAIRLILSHLLNGGHFRIIERVARSIPSLSAERESKTAR